MDKNTGVDLTLLSNFIHQVINPLNAIAGRLDNIIEENVSVHDIPQRLRAIKAQIEQSILLVRNLAYFPQLSMLDRSNKGIVLKECILPQVVIEAAQFYQEKDINKGIKIELDDKITQYCLLGIPELLRQVFMNLFDNAVKYCDEHSKIHVASWVNSNHGQLIVEVKNKGIGFEFEERENIFKLGIRSERAKSQLASGTGIGLFVCKEILERMFNASIEAEHSQSNRETCFRMRFTEFTIKERRDAK